MEFIKVKLCTVLLLIFGLTGMQAQEAILSSGGNAAESTGSASYSVGQVFYLTNATAGVGSVSEGVQQPYELSIVTGIEQNEGISLECSAYPNPTSDFLILKIKNIEFPAMYFKLYDIYGKLLEHKKIESPETIISMSDVSPSTYFLKLSENQTEIKSFKIIKN